MHYSIYNLRRLWITAFLILLFILFMWLLMSDWPKTVLFSEHSKNIKLELSNKSTGLFLAIFSATSNREVRHCIRETWLKLLPIRTDGNAIVRIVYKFVIGTRNLSEEIISILAQEQFLYSDLMLLPDLLDSYDNLTEKLLSSIQWTLAHVDRDVYSMPDFWMKLDDDSFVRLDILVKELAAIDKDPLLYWGFIDGRAHVQLTGPWAESNWILCDRYLPHARGGGYIIGSSLLRYVGTNSKLLQRYHSEDVSMGVWLAPIQKHYRHDPRFDTEFLSRGCNNRYLVTHKHTIESMREMYDSVLSKERLCPREFKRRLSYNYNWNVLPSLCCIRNDSTVP